MLAKYSWAWNSLWSVVDASSVTLLKDTGFLFPGWHQLQMAFGYGWYHAHLFACVCCHNLCEFIYVLTASRLPLRRVGNYIVHTLQMRTLSHSELARDHNVEK